MDAGARREAGGVPLSEIDAVQLAWLRQFLRALAWVGVAFVLLMGAAALLLESRPLLVGSGLVALVTLSALGGFQLAARGAGARAAGLVGGVVLLQAIGMAYLLPFGAPAIIVSIVLAVAAVMPHLERRQLDGFLVAAFVASLAVTLVADWSPHHLDLPHRLRAIILALAVPSAASLVVLLLWQWKQRTSALLAAQARARAEAESAREAARRSLEQMQTVLETISEGVTVQAPDGRLIFANDAAARIFGFASGAELLATPVGDLYARFELRDEDGATVGRDRLPGRLALQGEDTSARLLRAHDKRSGDERWTVVSAAAAVDQDGRAKFAVNVFRDHTERKRAEDAWRFLADASVALGSSLDLATSLTAVARLAVPRIADACAIDLIGAGGFERIAMCEVAPGTAPAARDGGADEVLRTGAPRLQQTTPVARWSIVVPLVVAAGRVGLLSFVTGPSGRQYDRADLALAQEIARRTAMAIENARLYADAQRAIRARDTFLTIASHELKTPLTSLVLLATGISHLHRAGREPGAAKLLARLQTLEEQGSYFAALVEQMLDVSRISSNQLVLERSAVDLVDVTRRVIARWRAQSEPGGAIRLSGAEVVVGSWDRMRVEVIASNLLGNAIKYGGQRPIEVRVEERDGVACLSVADEGPGIAPEDQARIFGQFERASSQNAGGLGLGLWIVRQFAQAHGGEVAVASRPGAGATFKVTLPKEAGAT